MQRGGPKTVQGERFSERKTLMLWLKVKTLNSH